MAGQTLNQKIINWATGRVGKSVGAGECWDLANEALGKSGANSSSDLGPTGDDDDYVWGDDVSCKDAIPGDVMQYRDHEMTTTVNTDVSFSDDSGYFDSPTVTVGHEHHTSVVSKNAGDGALTVLEQNHGGNHEKVKSTAMRWKEAPERKTTTRKMMKRKDNGKTEMATVVVTTTVSVSGTLTCYRPTAK